MTVAAAGALAEVPEQSGESSFLDQPTTSERIERLWNEDLGEAKFRAESVKLLRDARQKGMDCIRERFLASDHGGLRAASMVAELTDEIVRLVFDTAVRLVHPGSPDTNGDEFAVIAVGGYGRGEMAPYSDVDLLFLTAPKATQRAKNCIETILYILWDMRLKVGSAVRDVDSCLQLGQEDMTIRTTLLETRLVCGSVELLEELDTRAREGLFRKAGRSFIEVKLTERDERHEVAGGSRYLLNPNIKDGKGGLRDLQTLFWLAKSLHGPMPLAEFVRKGIFEPDEAAALAEAERNLWTWRFHLHFAAGRAEERMHFEHQESIAEALGFRDEGGLRPVERFMREYYRTAKIVGDLTRTFCAALEESEAKAPPLKGRLMAWLGRGRSDRQTEVDGFRVRNGRLAFHGEGQILDDPGSMVRIFHVSHEREMDIHPEADRLIAQSFFRIQDDVRNDPEINRLFLEVLTSRRNPIRSLRRMSENGVLGQFLLEFDHVIGLMQFDLYHHYTVDEHTLKTIEALALIEQGDRGGAHPLATSLVGSITLRRALYVALLFHDIGKGLGGNHSEKGAEILARLCPRLGLDEEEAETAVWLVRYHLLLNSTAQRRDLADPATIRYVAEIVQERQRLAMLLILTVCDMTSVAPDYWNEWKAQLLRDLHNATLSMLTSGQAAPDSLHRAAEAKAALLPRLAEFSRDQVDAFLESFGPTFWIGLDTDTSCDVARLVFDHEANAPSIRVASDKLRRAVKVCVYTQDRPSLLADLAGEIAAAGYTVVEVRSYVSKDSMSAFVFWMQPAFSGTRQNRTTFNTIQTRLQKAVVTGKVSKAPARRLSRAITEGLRVPTRVRIDNDASDLHTLIEVAARDRPGLLADLTRAMYSANAHVASAVVTTYGARAVDSFYAKNSYGLKITSEGALREIEEKVRTAADAQPDLST